MDRVLIVNFDQKFQVLFEQSVSVQIGFKNQSVIRDIYENGLSIKQSAPYYLHIYKFMEESSQAAISSIGSSASSASLVTVITNLVIQTVLGKALGSIWVAMNACQIIYYLPLVNLPFPELLKSSLKFLDFANGQDDWMGEPYFYKLLDLTQVEDKPVNSVFEEYGLDSSIFFFSYANKIQGWTVLLFLYPVILLASKFIKWRYIGEKLRSTEKMYRYNGLWRLLTEMYLEMTLSAFMNIYSLQFRTFTQALMSTVAILFMILLAYFPILTSTIISQNSRKLEDEEVEQTHGILYEGTRFESYRLLNQMYTPMFLYRRLTFVVILVLLKDYPKEQIFCLIAKNILYLSFFVVLMPFRSKMMNFQNILNEFATGLIFSICILYFGDLSEEESQFYSTLILMVIMTIIGFNFILVGVETVKGFISIFKSLKEKLALKLGIKTKSEAINQRYGQVQKNKSQISLAFESNISLTQDHTISFEKFDDPVEDRMQDEITQNILCQLQRRYNVNVKLTLEEDLQVKQRLKM